MTSSLIKCVAKTVFTIFKPRETNCLITTTAFVSNWRGGGPQGECAPSVKRKAERSQHRTDPQPTLAALITFDARNGLLLGRNRRFYYARRPAYSSHIFVSEDPLLLRSTTTIPQTRPAFITLDDRHTPDTADKTRFY